MQVQNQPHAEPAPPAPAGEPEPYLTIHSLARYVGCSVASARKYVSAGDLPPPMVIGSRATGGRAQLHRWRRADVDAWLAGERS